jgi:hypothetical protein
VPCMSTMAVCDVRCDAQAQQFGPSEFLMPSDYEAKADVTGFSAAYSLLAKTLEFPLTPSAREAFKVLQYKRAQFRVTAVPGCFTNRNGACKR